MTASHHAILAGFAFVLGSSVGSFLNVCIWRLPRGESLIRPGSRCPRCHNPIASRDNVPVLGWLLLRGRCRDCAGPISPRYPLVEAGVGLLFAGVVLADVALVARDPFDGGPAGVMAVLLYHFALVAVLVTVGMMARDERGLGEHGRATAGLGSGAHLTFSTAAALGGDVLGSLLGVLLLAVCWLRRLPARSAFDRVF